MKYSEWCQQNIQPVVDQYNDGAIVLVELVNSIVYQVMHRPEDLEMDNGLE